MAAYIVFGIFILIIIAKAVADAREHEQYLKDFSTAYSKPTVVQDQVPVDRDICPRCKGEMRDNWYYPNVRLCVECNYFQVNP